MERRATIYVHQRPAAVLVQHPVPGAGQDELRYLPEYLDSPGATAISLLLPLRRESYFSDKLFAYFDNLLPEGDFRSGICRSLRVDESDSFGLLLSLARYDSIGAVTVRGE